MSSPPTFNLLPMRLLRVHGLQYIRLPLLQTETALMHDAVWVLTNAALALNEANPQALASSSRVSCQTAASWEYGADLLGYMKSVSPCLMKFNLKYLFHRILYGIDCIVFALIGFSVLYLKEWKKKFKFTIKVFFYSSHYEVKYWNLGLVDIISFLNILVT